MATIQRQVADAQVASWVERHRCCEACGTRQRSKGSDPINFMTLYGDVRLCSPRLHHYQCQSIEGLNTVSPLRSLIPDHVAPERLYLEARRASLAPCAPRPVCVIASGGGFVTGTTSHADRYISLTAFERCVAHVTTVLRRHVTLHRSPRRRVTHRHIASGMTPWICRPSRRATATERACSRASPLLTRERWTPQGQELFNNLLENTCLVAAAFKNRQSGSCSPSRRCRTASMVGQIERNDSRSSG
jgi:hypothetical protein